MHIARLAYLLLLTCCIATGACAPKDDESDTEPTADTDGGTRDEDAASGGSDSGTAGTRAEDVGDGGEGGTGGRADGGDKESSTPSQTDPVVGQTCQASADCGSGYYCEAESCQADLTVTAVVDRTTVMRGELLSVQVLVTNPGSKVETADVTITLPQGIDRLTEYSSGGTCGSSCYAGDTIRYRLEDIQPGAFEVLWLYPVVGGNATNAPDSLALEFGVDLQTVGGRQVLASTSSEVVAEQPLQVRAALSPVPTGDAEHVVYEINYSNRGADPIDNVGLNLELPEGVAPTTEGDAQVDLGRLGPGEGGTRRILARVSAPAGRTKVATARLEGEGAPAASATAASVQAAPLLTASWSIEGSPAVDSEEQLVRLLISNPTDSTQTGTVTVLLPSFIERIPEQHLSPGASCSNSCYAGTTVSWQLEDLGPGASQTLWLRPTTQRSLPSGALLQYEAKVSPLGGNPHWLRAVSRAHARALNLELSADHSPVVAGDVLTYTLLYSNWSTDPVEPVQLRFELPAGTTHESGDSTLTFDLGRLRPGTGGRISVPVQVEADTSIATHLLARATLEETDRAHSEIWSSHGAAVAETLLQASLEMTNATVVQEELQPVRMTVTNPTADTQTIDVALLLPHYIDRVYDGNRTGGECGSSCYAGDTVRWRLADVPAGESRELFVRPVISRNTLSGTLLPYRVMLQPVGGNMQWVETTGRVDNARVLNLDLVADSPTPAPGEELSYSLHYSNGGSTPIDPAKLILNLPSGTTHPDGPVLEFNLGRITPGAGGVQQVSVTLDDDVSGTAPLLAAAELLGEGVAHASTHANALTTIGESSVDVSLSIDAVELDQQELHEISIVVANPGNSTENADVTLWLPLGIDRLQTANLSEGATCQNSCYAGTTVSWSVEDLGPGQTRTLWARAVVARNTLDGLLLGYQAEVAPLGASPRWLHSTARVSP